MHEDSRSAWKCRPMTYGLDKSTHIYARQHVTYVDIVDLNDLTTSSLTASW